MALHRGLFTGCPVAIVAGKLRVQAYMGVGRKDDIICPFAIGFRHSFE